MIRRLCDPECTAASPCSDCPCVPFDPIVGHACDLTVPSVRTHVYVEIDAERDRQIALGYTREHDLEHNGHDHLLPLETHYVYEAYKGRDARENLIKAAALLVAAIELLDADA